MFVEINTVDGLFRIINIYSISYITKRGDNSYTIWIDRGDRFIINEKDFNELIKPFILQRDELNEE
jgi:hypothetical protein